MVPAFPDVGALGRLAHRVESEAARQFLEVVKILAHGSLGPEPFRLELPDRGPEFYLYKLGSACHLSL